MNFRSPPFVIYHRLWRPFFATHPKHPVVGAVDEPDGGHNEDARTSDCGIDFKCHVPSLNRRFLVYCSDVNYLWHSEVIFNGLNYVFRALYRTLALEEGDRD